MKRPCPSSLSHGSISFWMSGKGIECKSLMPEYHVVPVLVYRIRGRKSSNSDGRVGISMCENRGVVGGLPSCHGAMATLLSKDLSLISDCCKI